MYGAALSNPDFNDHNSLYTEGELHWESTAFSSPITKRRLVKFSDHIPDTVLDALLQCSLNDFRGKPNLWWVEFINAYLTTDNDKKKKLEQ